MHKRISGALALGLVAATAVIGISPGPAGATGNGAPSGPHYNLNIVGGPGNGSGGASGNVIHVPLKGSCNIGLTEGSTFKVLDNSCNDGDQAQFQLPDPFPDGTLQTSGGTTAYSVYARALGKPGGNASMTSCFTDSGSDTYCSLESVILERDLGQSKFSNVSKELLTLCIDTDGDQKCDTRVGLFDDEGGDYWWQ